MTTRIPLAAALACAVPHIGVTLAFAQSTLYTIEGDVASAYLGHSLARVGDVDADGFDDFVVGIPGLDAGGSSAGGARVVSGRTGATIHTLAAPALSNLFGWSVAGAGDVNADGVPDVVAGTRGGFSGQTVSVRVFSGADGSVLHTFTEPGGRFFGESVSGAGDVDADGFDDVVVGAPGDSTAAPSAGRVRVYSGRDGSTLYTFDGSVPAEQLGSSVASAGDVDGDGHDDLVAGSRAGGGRGALSTRRGGAVVFSGRDGSVLLSLRGRDPGDAFGETASGAGDVNGDGFADFLVGAPGADHGGRESGSVFVFSGRDGSILYAFHGDAPGDELGASVASAGDVDRDGVPDVIAGAPGAQPNGAYSGIARVYSGADGSTVYTFRGNAAHDLFGIAVSGAGDVDGDGYSDLVIGAPQDDGATGDAGSVRVVAGRDTIGANYCTAQVNSTGLPAYLRAHGSIDPAQNDVTLRAAALPANRTGFFLASRTQGFVMSVPMSQGSLCLAGSVARYQSQVLNTGAAGTFELALDLTSIPLTPPVAVGAGETWNFQAWFRDFNPGPTSNFSDGLSIGF